MLVEPITIYTGPACPACRRTKMILDDSGLDYREIDVADRPEIVEELRAGGFAQLPVVFVPGMAPWSGLRPDMLVRVKAAFAQSNEAKAG
ncbi:NrdH-redoxin [Brevibacterium sp. SMBL_HHYL_HB1]|nr:NrdH-redoxin [Brevibacterium sp. SMBL_HHYL_HB1]